MPSMGADGEEGRAGEGEGEGASSLAVVLNIVKAVVGAGSFSLPYGVASFGWLASLIGTFVLAALCAGTIEIVSKVGDLHVDQRAKVTAPASTRDGAAPRSSLGASSSTVASVRPAPQGNGRLESYVALCWTALSEAGYPRSARWISVALYGAIVLTSIGACAAYLVFCAQMLLQVGAFPSVPPEKASHYLVWAMCGPLILLTWLPSFSYLAYTSIVGDIALATGLIVTVAYGVALHPGAAQDPIPLFIPSGFGRFFGVTAFLFAVHMLCTPLEASMARPARFRPLVRRTFTFLSIINAAFGTGCAILFGPTVNPLVISSMTSSFAHLPTVVRIALFFDLIFTYSIVLVPGRDLLERALHLRSPSLPRYLARAILVLITGFIAVTVRDFSDLVGLVSGLSLSYAAFIVPSFLYLLVLWPRNGSHPLGAAAALGVMGLGVVSAYMSTSTAIVSIVKNW